MADLSDVEAALARLAAAALYPAGQGSASIAGPAVTVRRGWPIADKLDADILAGKAQVTVFSRPGTGRLTTRFLSEWRTLPDPDAGITATVAGNTVTFTGTASLPVDAGVRAGGRAYTVHLPAGSTPAQVAAALAAIVPHASASGAVLTAPCSDLLARTAYRSTVAREIRRQSQTIALTVWAPTPDTRDAISAAIDVALAPLAFMDLPDNTRVRLQYSNSSTMDETSKAAIWRRDLAYSVEYPTVERIVGAPRMLFGRLEVHDTDGGDATHIN